MRTKFEDDHAHFTPGRAAGEPPKLHSWELDALLGFLMYYIRPRERALLQSYLPETYDKLCGMRVAREMPADCNVYFTVLIPWSHKPTEWHPTDREGPFSLLTRGAFPTAEAAHQWASEKLQGQPYSVRRIDP